MNLRLLLSILFLPTTLSAQNLILDGSFEGCTQNFECDWMKICESPDLFIGDLEKMTDPSLARKGHQAYSGSQYLGMFPTINSCQKKEQRPSTFI